MTDPAILPASSILGRYLTVAGLVALFSEENLIPLAGIGGFNSASGRVLDEAKLQAQIDRAQSLIDGYVLGRFPGLGSLTYETMPASLKGAAGDLVIYWLRDRVGDKGNVDDVVQTRYREVIRWLEGIRDGKTDFGASVPALTPETGVANSIQGSFPESRAETVLEGY